jgi:hypothetical protein
VRAHEHAQSLFLRPGTDDHEPVPLAQERQGGFEHERVILFGSQPSNRAADPGILRDAELEPHLAASVVVATMALDVHAVLDHDQPLGRALALALRDASRCG